MGAEPASRAPPALSIRDERARLVRRYEPDAPEQVELSLRGILRLEVRAGGAARAAGDPRSIRISGVDFETGAPLTAGDVRSRFSSYGVACGLDGPPELQVELEEPSGVLRFSCSEAPRRVDAVLVLGRAPSSDSWGQGCRELVASPPWLWVEGRTDGRGRASWILPAPAALQDRLLDAQVLFLTQQRPLGATNGVRIALGWPDAGG
jgi:hypothetical protein